MVVFPLTDDAVLLTYSEKLELPIRKLEDESHNYDLVINYKKTKVINVDRQNNNRPDITEILRRSLKSLEKT